MPHRLGFLVDRIVGRLRKRMRMPAPTAVLVPQPKPVDLNARTLVSGAPVPPDHSHTALKPNGQQRDYIVLTPEERARGFVRPVRRTYVHVACGSATTMAQAIAETYARHPSFYSGTFCVGCGKHFPLADAEDRLGAFLWDDGSAVGS